MPIDGTARVTHDSELGVIGAEYLSDPSQLRSSTASSESTP